MSKKKIFSGKKILSGKEPVQSKRTGTREEFLDTMDKLVPWAEFIGMVEPFYPKSGKRGRQPRGLELMLRMCFLRDWYNLSYEALEYNIYDSRAMRKFTKLDFSRESVPDATTLLKFRHLLDKHGLHEKLFQTVNAIMEKNGKSIQEASIVEPTLQKKPGPPIPRISARFRSVIPNR